nr:hypothetical protein HmN_000489300 [Hymenolepis microstoma]
MTRTQPESWKRINCVIMSRTVHQIKDIMIAAQCSLNNVKSNQEDSAPITPQKSENGLRNNRSPLNGLLFMYWEQYRRPSDTEASKLVGPE